MTVTASASADEPVLQLRSVSKSFTGPAGPRSLLTGLDLRVDRGEIVAVAGRSGSGKTTLLTLIAGLEAPDSGSIRLLGGELPATIPWTDVAIVPQSLGLLDELTVAENVGLPLRLGKVPGDGGHADDLMEVLGLGRLADRFPNEISLGEQQRAALARAVIVRPRVLLADEPISHQNDAWARTMLLLLDDLTDWGTACLLATHNEVAFRTAHRVLDLRDGRLHPLRASSAT